jgi:DNA polymerase
VTDAERQAALEAIAREVAACSRCRLHAGRTRPVPGEGNPATEVVFVGEGPGEQEDRQGRPFVGASGQLLTELIASLGWSRSDVYITNVVKCRPPGNRDPQPDEIAACAPVLRRQLEALDPAVVVTVGKHSLNTFRPGERIGRVHGTATPADPATGAAEALVFSMYHPAFALYQGSNRQTLFEDIARLPGSLLAARDRRRRSRAAGQAGSAADGGAPQLGRTAARQPARDEPHGGAALAAAAEVAPTETPAEPAEITSIPDAPASRTATEPGSAPANPGSAQLTLF